jgi:ribonuclease P protein component
LRLHQYELPNLDIVFMGRKGLDKSTNEEIYQLLNKQFTKLKKRASAC